MIKPAHARKVLPKYRENLEKLLRGGNEPKIAVQKALIARLEEDAEA